MWYRKGFFGLLLGQLSKGRRRKQDKVAKRRERRLTLEGLEQRQLLWAAGLTITPLPPIIVSQGTASTVVSLSQGFHGPDGWSEVVRYDVVGDSNPALFAAAPFAIPIGQMLLRFAPDAAGAALLTFQATTLQGQTADAKLLVCIAAAQTATAGGPAGAAAGRGRASQDASLLSQALIGTIAGVPPYYGGAVPASDAAFQFANGVAVDTAGNIYVADCDANVVYEINHDTGIMTAVAGNGIGGYSGDGGAATAAELNNPIAVAVDSSGDLFIADSGNEVIREVSPSGTITTFAGNGQCGYSGDDGPATNAEFTDPNDVAVDSAGDVFIADTFNDVVREVYHATGEIATVAGTGAYGYSGDGGAATAATLAYPAAVAVDSVGNLYIADLLNCVIRKVDASGTITTFAGTGQYGYSGDGVPATAATMGYPTSVAVDSSGDLFIGDDFNNVVREVDAASGKIYTIAGTGVYGYSGDGEATSAEISYAGHVAVDAAGDIIISGGTGQVVREVSHVTQVITTIAGNGALGYTGDGGPAPDAAFQLANGIATDATGNVYVVDTYANVVRKIDSTTGIITTIAGTGTAGYSGDGGPATDAELNDPTAVAVDSFGNVFISDYGNDVVREVDPSGTITTFAGNGQWGYSGDGGLATNAELASPQDVAVDSAGDVFIADLCNNVVREVYYDTGDIATVAGSGGFGDSGDGGLATSATLSLPAAVAVDAAGNLYIADLLNCVIRKVDASGTITTFAGDGENGYSGDGGLATEATMGYPTSIAVDASGDLFIADDFNNAIREVSAANGYIYTIAGNGTAGYSGDGGPATAAELSGPGQVAVDAAGNVFGDDANDVIREIDSPSVPVPTVSLAAVSDSAVVGQAFTITATVSPPSPGGAMPTGNVQFFDGTDCLGFGVLDTSGNASLTTSALSVGEHDITAAYCGSILVSSGISSVADVEVDPISTAVSLTASTSSLAYGQGVTFTATVDPSCTDDDPPSGTVDFYDGSTLLGSAAVVSGQATFNPASPLFVGMHAITARYEGDDYYSPSCSTNLDTVITPTTLDWDPSQSCTEYVGGSGTWSSASNDAYWFDPASGTDVPWGDGDNAVFSGSANTVTIDGSVSPASIDFDTGGYVVSDGSLVLPSGGATIDAAAGATIVSSITGPGGLTKVGSGTLTLAAANEYTGGTDVEAGQLTMGNAAALGSSSSTLTLHGGSLDVNGNVLVQTSVVIYAGVIDLSTGGLVVNTANFGYVPLGGELSPQGAAGVLEWGAPAVHDAVEDGSNLPDGDWNGARGILSSSAANDTTRNNGGLCR